MQESISFYYGRLMAIFEKIELDAVSRRGGDAQNKGEQVKGLLTRIGYGML